MIVAKRAIAMVVLTALAALPVSAAVCLHLCAAPVSVPAQAASDHPPAAGGHDHHSGYHDPAPAVDADSEGLTLQAGPGDCGTHRSPGLESLALAATRADAKTRDGKPAMLGDLAALPRAFTETVMLLPSAVGWPPGLASAAPPLSVPLRI